MIIKHISGLLLTMCLMSTLIGITITAAGFNLSTSVRYNSSLVTTPYTINTATPFTYYVNYACQSTVGNCQGNKIILDIPKIQPINETLPSGITKSYDSNLNKYILEFTAPTPSGTTGQIGINMQIQQSGTFQGETLPIKVSSIPSGSTTPETYPAQDFTLIAGNGLQYQEGIQIRKFMFNSNPNIVDGKATFFSQVILNASDSHQLNNTQFVDVFPTNLNATKIKLSYTSDNNLPVAGITGVFEYQTDQNSTWITLANGNLTYDGFYEVSNLNLPAGDRIKAIRGTIPTLPAGSIPIGYKNIALQAQGNVINPTDNLVVTNCGSGTASDSSTNQNYTANACDSVTYKVPVKTLQYNFSKVVSANTPASPGETAIVEMQLGMNPESNLPITNPVMYDLLPAGQILDETMLPNPYPNTGYYTCVDWYCVRGFGPFPGPYTYTPQNAPAPIVTKTPNFNNTGRTLLKFDWTGTSSLTLDGKSTNAIPYISTIQLRFKVKFDPTLPRTP